MKKLKQHQKVRLYLYTILLLLTSCISYRFIEDSNTVKLQKEIQSKRTGKLLGDTFLTLGSAILAAFTGVLINYIPDGQKLKRIALVNDSKDTLQINMLTDKIWKDSTYCDFRDIRIPPGQKCRLLIPLNSEYNLYFSNTIGREDDDELIELNSSAKSKIILYPGMTFQNKNDTITNKMN